MNNNNSIEDSHENVHNTQENQVNNNEINIDIIENNNQKKPFYKQKKFIIGTIIGVAVILLTVIVLVIVLKGKDKDEDSSKIKEFSNSSHSKSLSNSNSNIKSHSKSNSNSDPSINDSSSNEEPDNIIEYKISSKYYESINNIITTYNLEQNINLANTRRLDDNSYEMKKTKTIKSKYLLNIIPQNDDLFTAYIAILSRDEVSEDVTIETFNDSEIINNDDDNNFKAVAKFDFYKNGTKKETSFLKNTQIIYQNEIEAIIPCLIPSLNSNKNKLNKTSYSLQDTVNQPIIIGNNTLELSNSEIEVVTLNQQVNNVKMNSTSKMANSEFESDENIELDSTSTINSLLKSMETTSNQNINYLNEDGELIAKKYEEKFKKLEFEEPSSRRLRLLSNEKYVENIRLKTGNEKEYKNIKNIRELVDVDFTSSLEFPLTFRYEIFKIDAIGLKFSLTADIEWVPTTSTIIITLKYHKGENVIESEPNYLTIPNYKEVILSYKTIIITIISYLKDEIIQKIDNNYVEINNLLNEYLLNYADKLNEILEPLSTLFNDSLKSQLDLFKAKVFNYAHYCYNEVYFNITLYLDTHLADIERDINSNQQNEINQLVNESNSTIINLIGKQEENITNLINSVKIFIRNSIESLNKLTNTEKVSIDFYYRVKEIFKRIDVLIDSFDDIVITSMEKEYLQLQIYANDNIYLNEIDSLLDQIEVIWDIFYNNQILNETVTGDHATGIVDYLVNVRNRYLNIKDKLLSSVKNVYDSIKNNELSIASSNIQSLKKDLNIEENSFIDFLTKKVRFIKNYTLYNEDIKNITIIENKISDIKINAFKTNIINKLKEITKESFISSNEMEKFKNETEKEIGLFINNLKNHEVNKYKTNINNILSKFDNLVSESKIKNIITSINQKFNSAFLTSLIKSYYKTIIDNGITQYSELEEKILNINIEEYLTEPVELINKIKSISKNKENLDINKFKKVVNETSSNLFDSIISDIKNLISNEINNITIELDENKLDKYNEIINEFFENCNKSIETLENKKSDYKSLINSEFDISSTIDENEKTIETYINNITDNLLKKFHYLFCTDSSSDCPNAGIKKMDSYDKYYFQVSKLRDALNHLTLLEPYINGVINDDNLKELSSVEFLNKYKNPNDFDNNTISGEIKRFLFNLNYEGKLKTQENVNQLKEIIKNGFASGYNLTQQIYTTFLKTLLETPNDLQEKLDKIFIVIKRKAREGYDNDINYHINNKFYFNSANTKLEDEFNDMIEDYINKLKDKQKNVLNSLTIDNEFNKTLITKFEDKIYNDINTYQRELLLNFSYLGEQTCMLLDYKITFETIVIDAITELKNQISSNIKTNYTSQYEIPLNEFKQVIYEYFDNFNNDFKANYLYFFNNYRNYLLNSTEVIKSSSYEVTSLTNLIKEGFEKGLNYGLNEIENIINQNSFSKIINNIDKINEILNKLFSNIGLTIVNLKSNINNNINNLKVTCEQEFKREKDIFKDNVLEYIIKGFNKTVKEFINGTGKSYLNDIYLNDYENKIVSKLDYILSQCKEIDEYLYLIIKGIFDCDSYLTDSVEEVYYQLMNYINDGITHDKISAKILKKLRDFKYDSAKEIVIYFNNYTKDILNSNSFKNSFSLQVRQLIPTYIPKTILLNFTQFYYEFLDSVILENIYSNYSTKIDEMKENIIKKIDKFRFERVLQAGKIGQGMSNSNIASAIVEYNTLNASLSKINNDFSYELSDSKKRNAYNLLASTTLKNDLKTILYAYQYDYEKIQKNITKNVFFNVSLTDFNIRYDILKNNVPSINSFDIFEEIRERFKENILDLFTNFESNVKTNYSAQVSVNTKIKPINFNLRRLDSDIKIESIQSEIDKLDIKFTNLSKVISNPENLINIFSKLSQINNAINVQLISLNNTLETYLSYVEFYLHKNDTLHEYENNMTKIYLIFEESLNEFKLNLSNIITKIYNSFSKYKSIYDDEIKSNLIEKINKIIKESSKLLLKDYLKNSSESNSTNINKDKKTDLSNLGGLTSALGSTRLNYTTNVDNTILKYGYNLNVDEDNYKVYLNITANASVDANIIYQSEHITTSLGGTLGEGMIGLDLEMDFLNEDVNAIYKTKFNNTIIEKVIYENTTISAWNNCSDAIDCFERCPNAYTIENNKTIEVPSESDYSTNSSIYTLTSYTKVCSYSRYLGNFTEHLNSFNSSLKRTI